MQDHGGGKYLRIHYRRHAVILVRLERFGRVAMSYTEIAFRRFARPVCCRMHGNTRVSESQRKEDCETDTMCGESHANSDHHSRELFKRA